MSNNEEDFYFDVIISGAGPAGCACALALKDSGLKVAMFDRKSFPRDKVCGDAIPLRAIKTLRSISPAFGDALRKFEPKLITKKTRLVYGKHSIDLNWVGEAYTCARLHFDDFLFQLVKNNTSTTIYENAGVDKVTVSNNVVQVKDKTGRNFTAKFIVGADGAHSVVAKQLANRTVDRKHHVGSVRAYYTGVKSTDNNATDIYFDKRFFPSYLWVFPVQNDIVNVGFGMLSSEIAKRKLNIKNALHDFIAQNPELRERFVEALPVGELEGFGLPLGSRRVQVSGDHFILTGDAASLIDPITGDGIGNAMLSGKLAAAQVLQCFKVNDFSAGFIKSYDKKLFRILGVEFKIRANVQRLVPKMPFLVDMFFWVTKNKIIKNLLQKGM